MRSLGFALATLTFALVPACASALGEGEAEFKKGRYPEAKQTFESLETEAAGYGDARRAEYALYRGLTLGALGDRAAADVWLREAKTLEATRPETLSPEDTRRMKAALDASGP